MTAALICFVVLCLSALVVVTLDDSNPEVSVWDGSESNE